jgi:hypothetical protein
MLGTFLRAFTFGPVRQLDRLLAVALRRAWQAGAGPGDGRLVVDVDSFVGEVHRHAKQGAAFGYSGRRGYHPLLATRAETGEVSHVCARARRPARAACCASSTSSSPRVQRAGAAGTKLPRADNAFWNNKLTVRLEKAGWQYSISVRMQAWVPAAIAQIPEDAWRPLEDYPRAARRRSPRPPPPAVGGWSCAAPAWSDRRPICGRTGGTSRSSPTAPSR